MSAVTKGKSVEVVERKSGRTILGYEVYVREWEEKTYPPTPSSPDGVTLRTKLLLGEQIGAVYVLGECGARITPELARQRAQDLALTYAARTGAEVSR